MSTASPAPDSGPAPTGPAVPAESPAPAARTAPTLRRAMVSDLPAVVAMLADDPLGADRESPDQPESYRPAFDRIAADPNQYLLVADAGGRAVGTLQLTFVPGLARRGATRAVIEAVRVYADVRGDGLGTRMIEWAVGEARRQGCVLVQLTSDATRSDAHRFYERLGFEPSHIGFKMAL